MAMKRLRILLVAYACRPGESSEREVGWKWANLIHERHEVAVLTRETHRLHIEAFIAKNGEAATFPAFVYYDLPAWVRWLKKGERGLYIYYALWSFFAILKTRRMNRERHWDITHFLTFGTLIWPQFAFLMNTRYILGPVGGGERIPLSLLRAFSASGQVKIILRRLIQWSLAANPIYWANLLRADRILVRTHETFELVPSRFHTKTVLLLETAMPDAITIPDRRPPCSDRLAIVSVGRLIASKFNRLLLEALYEFKQSWKGSFTVTIIGEGPERSRLEVLRDVLGLEEVVFVGQKRGEDVFTALQESDIYFSLTMKEGGTWAFFEAIACRLPIVCLKVNGPDMIVGDGCGIKVPPGDYVQARTTLAKALVTLAEDPALRADYAEKALAYIEETYTWTRVQDSIDAIYRDVMGDSGSEGNNPIDAQDT